MATITISKIEYDILKKKADFYEYIRRMMERDIFTSPPTKDAKEIMGALIKTRRYNKAFLNSLERGLKRSSYFHS